MSAARDRVLLETTPDRLRLRRFGPPKRRCVWREVLGGHVAGPGHPTFTGIGAVAAPLAWPPRDHLRAVAMPPRFRVGPAVVNIGAMAPDMTETVVGFAEAALRDCMNENQMATSIRLALSGKWSDKTWQVRVGTCGCGAARRGARGCRRRRREQTQRGCPSRIARALPPHPAGARRSQLRLFCDLRGQALRLLLHWADVRRRAARRIDRQAHPPHPALPMSLCAGALSSSRERQRCPASISSYSICGSGAVCSVLRTLARADARCARPLRRRCYRAAPIPQIRAPPPSPRRDGLPPAAPRDGEE
jgi:hypothetical protein